MEPKVTVNHAEKLVNTPVRWSVAIVAIALMFALALNVTVRGIYATLAQYESVITSTESQLAAAMLASKRGNSSDNAPMNAAPKESDRIIVKYKDNANLPPGLSIAAERANLEKAQGLVKVTTIKGINADVYQVNENDTAQEVVDRLLASSGDLIEYVEVDMLASPDYVPNDPNLGNAWHINKVVAPTAWENVQGTDIVVAIADSGVDCTHPDLATSCVSGFNVYANNTDTRDTGGHGTLVAGTAAQLGDNGVGSAGIAYKAKIMPIQITNGVETWAYYSDMAEAVVYAADNGARVANISYSGACSASSVINAASYMRSKGGVVTASAGNTGADNGMAASSLITCVSATASNDARTSWSSWGASVDAAAPGASIYTTTRGGSYSAVNGTSFSAPLTAGIYALMFAANPALTPAQADNILFSSVDDIGEAGWDMYYGYGRVNAAKAVAAASAAVGAKDTVPPSVPANLRATTMTANSVSLAWNAATDDNSGVAGYSVYRNAAKVATVSGTSYTSSGLAPNTAYSFTVRAEDAQGNVSADSAPVAVTTPDVSFAVSSYSVPQKTNTGATVAATLTKPGTVTVKYGLKSSALNLEVSSTASSMTNHSVNLTGLTAGTTYYYQIVATDGTTTITTPVSSFKTSKGGTGKPR